MKKKIRSVSLALLFLFWTGLLFAQLKPADVGSTVKFRIKNFGFNVEGSFTGLQGLIHFDPANIGSDDFDVSVNAASVSTGNDMRDDHLREDSYFDVKNHPVIRFVSTKVTTSNKKGTLFVFGKLTIKNTTREISFPFTATEKEGGYLFSGEFKINRRDFNIGGSSTISDNLEIILNVLAVK